MKEKEKEKPLFALIDERTGKLVIDSGEETAAPWEGATKEEAELEVVQTWSTFREADAANPQAALAREKLAVVPLTPELETAYRQLGENRA